MLTLKLLRENPEFVIEKLAKKNFDAKEIVEKINALDVNRRALQTELDGCLAEQKKKAAMIGGFMKEGKKVLVFKKKRRKGYQKMNGHRQYLTKLQINAIA